jgi:hypothetical protein
VPLPAAEEDHLAERAVVLPQRQPEPSFGTAYEQDGVLIIPVAIVAGGGGGGTSRNRRGNAAARPDNAHDATAPDSVPIDAGGGFGGIVLPSGAYVVKGDQVRWSSRWP